MTVGGSKTVAVIGGGIQGLCVSLSLAERGCRVDLYEENATLISEASLWNEGKIHLGFVYGNDPTAQTAATLMRGSLRFAGLLDRWCGGFLTESEISTPFRYAVHRESQLSPDQVSAHFATVQALMDQCGPDRRKGYFGLRERSLYRRLTEAETAQDYDSTQVVAAFQTEERSVDPQAVARRLSEAVTKEPRITPLLGQRVDSCDQDDDGTPGLTLSDNPRERRPYDAVVNATWRDRLRLDATYGRQPERPWLFRYKVALHTERSGNGHDRALPSTTIVLGPYGDIVNFGEGRYYLSWYPAGCIASTPTLFPEDPLHAMSDEAKGRITAGIMDGLARVVPACRDLNLSSVDAKLGGGQIFAWGQGDIDDPQSQLHQRFEIGLRSFGRYHSIDTGKYCMAPLFAEQVAERICPPTLGDRRIHV